MVNLKGGCSPSYMTNNLAKSDTYIAFVKNTFSKPMVSIYKLCDLENESLQPELIKFQYVEWDAKQECCHINYLYINQKWYLVIGFVGYVELYNEDGSKRYFTSKSQISAEEEIDPLERPAFTSSCVGHFGDEKDENNEYLIFGTSHGEIY